MFNNMNPLCLTFLPLYITINKLTKNDNYGRIFFYNILVLSSCYEIYDKNLYNIIYLDFADYNYIGKQTVYISLQYFLYDLIFYVDAIDYAFHHLLILFFGEFLLYKDKYYVGTLFISLNEISTIFLSLKILNIKKELTSILLYFSFFIFRISLVTSMLFNKNLDTFSTSFLIMQNGINYYWFLSSIYKKLKNSNNSKKLVYNTKTHTIDKSL